MSETRVLRTRISDGSSWPQPENVHEDLAWRLTYIDPPSRSDLLAAASVVSAYNHLMLNTTAERRALVVREVRAAVHKTAANPTELHRETPMSETNDGGVA